MIIEYFYNIVAIIGFLILAGLAIAYLSTLIAIAKAKKEQELTDNEQKTDS